MSSAGEGSSSNRTVLVIESDESVRKLLRTVLAQNGFRTLEGAGVHALALCQALGQRVDAVLCEEPLASTAGVPQVRLDKPFLIPQLIASLRRAMTPPCRRPRRATRLGGAEAGTGWRTTRLNSRAG